MNKDSWKEVVGKTKWASKKKRLGKKELIALQNNALALEKFMGQNKSDFANVSRREVFKPRDHHNRRV